MRSLETLLRRWGIRPEEIAGAALAGEIPIRESFINRLIATRLEHNSYIAAAIVTVRDGDEALVRVVPRIRLLPELPIVVRIERQPDLPRDPVLVLRWHSSSAGPLGPLAGTIARYVRSLPPGIQVDRDVIAIDLRTLLQARGLEDALALVRRAAVHTRPGAVIVQLEAGIG
jgi:hypothetical protein